jgi:SAM-dependent methyltransferase
MDRAVFDRMAEQDQVHWWYVARRKILAALIARQAGLPQDARILEIGCGTGHNFEMLKSFGRLDALEVDEEVRALACERLGHKIGDAPLPDLPGVPDGCYDLVALLDVLEHVDDRAESLRSIAAKLRPDGRILVTVPAYQWMWSAHDVAHHHKLRYSKKGLRRDAEAAGLKVLKLGFFNSILFPAAALIRFAGKLADKPWGGDGMPPLPLNFMLEKIFGLERYAIGRFPFSPGVSIFALLSTR